MKVLIEIRIARRFYERQLEAGNRAVPVAVLIGPIRMKRSGVAQERDLER